MIKLGKWLWYCVLVVGLGLVSQLCRAQTNPHFSRFTSEAGLGNDYIRCVYRDHLGFVWVGTFDGLTMFDGLKFRNYKRDFNNPNSVPSNTVMDVKEDKLGRLWLATAKGICTYDRSRDNIQRMKFVGADTNYFAASFDFDNENHLWVVGQYSLGCFQVNKNDEVVLLQRFTYPNHIPSLNYRRKILHQDGQVKWLMAGDQLLQVDWKNKKLVHHSFKDKAQKELGINGVLYDRAGQYWAMSTDQPGIFKVDSNATSETVTEIYSPPFTSREERFICWDNEGIGGSVEQLCLGSQGSGLFVFDLKQKTFANYQYHSGSRYSLSNDQINALYRDKEDMLWVGTAYGLDLYDPLRQQLQTTALPDDMPEDMITDVLPMTDEKAAWVGTETHGLYRYEEATKRFFHYPLPGVQHKVQYLYMQANGVLWIGCEDGLYNLNPATGKIKKARFKVAAPVSVSCIIELGKDSLMITSFESGCWLYNCTTGEGRRLTSADGLYSDRCTYMSKNESGKVFITHIGTGISMLDLQSMKITPVPFQPFTEKELSYPATFTYCSYPENDSILWVGTGLGLVRYNYLNNTGGLIPAGTRLKTDNEIWSIIPGTKPYLWLKTTFGVYKFNTRNNTLAEFHPLDRRNIKAQDGYFRMRQWDERSLVIPAYHSFHTLQYSKPVMKNISGKMVLLHARVENEDRYLASNSGNIDLLLHPGESSLDLQFVAPDFHHPEYTGYTYRLNDEQWHELNSNSLSFPDLKPGKHKLEIKAKNYDDIDSENLVLHIDVRPYIWQTPWFYLFLLLAIAGGLYLLYRYRLSQILALQKVRLKISKDLHDDIGATVSSIGILADIAKNKDLAESKKMQYLDTISEESKYVAEALSDIVWTINPKNDSMQMIFARLLRYATELLDAQNIIYDIEIPDEEELKNVSLGMEERQHLYLILKEAVNNLVKYSGAIHANIEVIIKNGQLTVHITDNGRGFDQNKTAHGNGIANMKKRAAEVKGKLEIKSAPGKGTEVILNVPI